jgi:hypothetical protein
MATGLLKSLEADVLEIHRHGRPGMQLQRQDALFER